MGQVEFRVDAQQWPQFTRKRRVQAQRRFDRKVEPESRCAHQPFGKQCSPVRAGGLLALAGRKLALVRHIALNLLNQQTSAKLGIKNERVRAGWDEDYLLKVLLY